MSWVWGLFRSASRTRVPLTLWAAILLTGPVLSISPASSLLYVGGNGWHDFRVMSTISAAAILASAACLINFHLVLWETAKRKEMEYPKWYLNLCAIVLACASPGVFLYWICRFPGEVSKFHLWIGILAGGLIAGLVVFVSEALRNWVEPKDARSPVFFVWPTSVDGNARGPLARLRKRSGLSALKEYSGHFYAALVLALTLLLYWFFAGQHLRELVAPGTELKLGNAVQFGKLPALAWLMFLIAILAWALSGLSYWLDRIRFPFLLALGLGAWFAGGNPATDHFFRTEQANSWTRKTATDSIRERGGNRIILVSAPGGGIQSAAWTTYVLNKLNTDGRFMKKIAAISSVSGGSVGVFHLAAANFQTQLAYQNAKKGSIDDVAWGWFVPDLTHALMGLGDHTMDRGWALEKSLEQNAGAVDLFLDQIQPSATTPALIMNSTMLESGRPIVFSTSKFLAEPVLTEGKCGNPVPDSSKDPYDYWDIYKNRVRAVTAARLSATFPYVSPAARPLSDKPDCAAFHMLDGDYFDNYGIESLARWLQSGIEGNEAPGKQWKVLLVRLFAFEQAKPEPSLQGWRSQFIDPVIGVLNARDESQLIAGQYLQRLLNKGDLEVVPAEFRYRRQEGCSEPPLNWVLTSKELLCLEQSLPADEVQRVMDFLEKM